MTDASTDATCHLTEAEAFDMIARAALGHACEAGVRWAAAAILQIGDVPASAHDLAGVVALDLVEHLETIAAAARASTDQRRTMIVNGVGAYRAELERLAAHAHRAVRA